MYPCMLTTQRKFFNSVNIVHKVNMILLTARPTYWATLGMQLHVMKMFYF